MNGSNEPIIKNGRPTRLPRRGPMQLQNDSESSHELTSILNQTESLLGVVRDCINDDCSLGGGSLHQDTLPLMKIIHRNLLYLAVNHEISGEITSGRPTLSHPMHSANESISGSDLVKTEQELLMEGIAAALRASETGNPANMPIVADIGSVILQLSQAVADARNDAEREKQLRLNLEREHEVSRFIHGGSLETESTIADDKSSLGFSSTNNSYNTRTSTALSAIESALPLADCLRIMNGVAGHIAGFIAYSDSAGFVHIDLSRVERIFAPRDCSNLMLILINVADGYVVPEGLVPFSLANLQAFLAYPSPQMNLSPVHCSTSSVDDVPRMNLLEALNVHNDEDCSRIVTVRKCHKLGFRSHVHLKQYFSKFGKVERVVLLPMRAKPKNSFDGRGTRPSSMGFIVMSSVEAVGAILGFDNSSRVHEVKGWPIEVRNFVRPADKPDMDFTTGTTQCSRTKSTVLTDDLNGFIW